MDFVPVEYEKNPQLKDRRNKVDAKSEWRVVRPVKTNKFLDQYRKPVDEWTNYDGLLTVVETERNTYVDTEFLKEYVRLEEQNDAMKKSLSWE